MGALEVLALGVKRPEGGEAEVEFVEISDWVPGVGVVPVEGLMQ